MSVIGVLQCKDVVATSTLITSGLEANDTGTPSDRIGDGSLRFISRITGSWIGTIFFSSYERSLYFPQAQKLT